MSLFSYLTVSYAITLGLVWMANSDNKDIVKIETYRKIGLIYIGNTFVKQTVFASHLKVLKNS